MIPLLYYVFLQFSTEVEPSEGSAMVGGAHTLSSAKFQCSPLYPLANSECFSPGRIIATSI